MNWDDMRIFLALAREGSVSGAARRLGVQHSTVSRRLKGLEEALATRLAERRPSGLCLTEAGEELRHSAEKMEAELLGLESAISGQEEALSGTLTVSAINNMASTVLMPMFARFSRAHPEIELRVQVSNKYVSLAERDADVAIRLTNTPLETLIGTRLVTVASTVYGGRDYLSRLAETGGEPCWIGVNCCEFHRSWTRAACPDSRHNLVLDDTLLTLAALREGMGLAYLPCFMGDADPLLRRHCDPDPALELGLWLVYHPDLRRTSRVRLFRRHMLAEMAAARPLFEGHQPRG